MGSKLRQRKMWGSSQKKNPIDEAREILTTTILAHVPVCVLVLESPSVLADILL